jgi:murein DD-endopeptidase MepM/ murein hydrolase activator NlpD
LHKASADSVNVPRGCRSLTAWEAWHAFYIDHGNGYTSWYLHADSLDPAIEAAIGSDYTTSVHVNRGDQVAFTGTFGPCGDPEGVAPQLHFEVRKGLDEVVDPYSEAFWIAP